MTESRTLLKVQSDLNNLSNIRSFIMKAADKLEVSDDAASEICLAVDEACANIIIHGYKETNGNIVISVNFKNNKMIVTVSDEAPLYNPLNYSSKTNLNVPLSERPLGGMGVMLIKQNTDLVEYETTSNGGNTLRMTKNY